MADNRRTLSTQFKAKVAIEAIKGEKTINELAKEHGVHPGQITQWKKALLEKAPEAFTSKSSAQKTEDDFKKQEDFYLKEIGTLQTQVEWLKKKMQPFGL